MDPKKPLDAFRHYFSVRPAVTTADREETYRIRYRVYCEEFGYEPKERFSNRMETDEIDDISAHCLITHVATGMPAGCMRICPAALNGIRRSLPLEKCCTESLDPAAMARMTAPRDAICEASRFAVDGAFRRRSGEALTRFGEIAALDFSDHEKRTFPLISMALMLAGAAMAELLDRPHMFAVMEPFLPRLLKRSGVVFQRMGKDVDHHGIRAVYLTDARDFVRDMDADMRILYRWISGQLHAVTLGGRSDSGSEAALSPSDDFDISDHRRKAASGLAWSN